MEICIRETGINASSMGQVGMTMLQEIHSRETTSMGSLGVKVTMCGEMGLLIEENSRKGRSMVKENGLKESHQSSVSMKEAIRMT